MSKSGINWANVVLTDDTGAMNVEQTLAYLREELVEHVATNDIPTEKIRAACDEVFSHVTQIDLNGLASRCANILQAPIGAETKVQKRVLEFVRAESKTFKDSKGERGGFLIMPGAGNGTRKASPATVEQYNKLLAKRAAKDTTIVS